MTRAAEPSAGSGFYPERIAGQEAPIDRWAAALGFRLQSAFSRGLRDPAALASRVGQHAARLAAGKPATRVSGLRYRLRRDGWVPENLAECLALCSFSAAGRVAAPEVLGAAAALVRGAIVDAAEPALREQALGLAALALAVSGTPVHLLSATEARARRAAESLQGPLEALGLGVRCIAQGMEAEERRKAYRAAVVCATQREIGFDYLRDRVRIGSKPRALHGLLERLAGDAPRGEQLMLGGLHCALVEDADLVLLDDAHAPLVISAEADVSGERLLYEQALELANALSEGADFALEEGEPALLAAGAQRLAQLSVLLGPVWAARQRREELVSAALEALHLRVRGRDYGVEQGRIVFPPPPAEAAPREELVRPMVELKEGSAPSRRRDVLFRTSVPRFFARYLQLAGVCGDARGLEGELWGLYALKTRRAGPPQEAVPCAVRVFPTTAERRDAAVRAARARAAAGMEVVIAARSPAEAQALATLLGPDKVELSVYPAHRDAARKADPARPLHLIVAELHDARRHVDQIARAFGAVSCEMLIALEDKAVAAGVGPFAGGFAGPGWIAFLAQRGIERARGAERREIVLRERQLDDLLAFSGTG